jgi:hypothetical protein
MSGDDVRSALSDEIDLLKALQGAAAPFTGTALIAGRIIGGWKGSLAVLIEELEEMITLSDDDLKARLKNEIDLNDAFLDTLKSWSNHPDADSWRRFFEEENEIARELIKLI